MLGDYGRNTLVLSPQKELIRKPGEESNEVLGDLCPLLALLQCHSWADLFLVHVNAVNQAEPQ